MHVMQALDEERIAQHLDAFLGKSDGVMHGIGGAHVYIYRANHDRPFQTLVTMGLSGFEMPVPENQDDREESLHVELFTYVPADWPVPRASGAPGYWPYAMLLSLAEYAVSEEAWLGPFHTIPNLTSTPYGQPFESESHLSHCLLLPPVKERAGFDRLKINGRTVRFLHVLPITGAECDVKVRDGFFDSLAGLLDDGMIPTVIDPKRRSAV